MRKAFWILAFVVIVVCLALKLPRSAIDPTAHIGLSINNKAYIWEPLRRLRIRMLVQMGGSPNDVVMGESLYAMAVMAEDTWFLTEYGPITSPMVLADGLALACDGRNEDVIAAVSHAVNKGETPNFPHCEPDQRAVLP